MDSILIAIMAVNVIGCLWAWRCNNKTFEQRTSILNDIHKKSQKNITSGDFDWKTFHDPFDEVTYSRHFWMLFFLLDPSKLYRKVV